MPSYAVIIRPNAFAVSSEILAIAALAAPTAQNHAAWAVSKQYGVWYAWADWRGDG
jgi:hypothetical protein